MKNIYLIKMKPVIQARQSEFVLVSDSVSGVSYFSIFFFFSISGSYFGPSILLFRKLRPYFLKKLSSVWHSLARVALDFLAFALSRFRINSLTFLAGNSEI